MEGSNSDSYLFEHVLVWSFVCITFLCHVFLISISSTAYYSELQMVAEITYDLEEKMYYVCLLCGIVGFFINGTRLEVFERRIIEHGDVLQYGDYQLISHIHYG